MRVVGEIYRVSGWQRMDRKLSVHEEAAVVELAKIFAAEDHGGEAVYDVHDLIEAANVHLSPGRNLLIHNKSVKVTGIAY